MALRDWIQQGQNLIQEIVDRPESSTAWIQQLPRPLSRKILAYASELLEPGFWGSGLRMKDLSRDRIWLELPHRRKQSLSGGEIQAGALLSVAEWAFRILWAQQTHLSHATVRVESAHIEVKESLKFDVWLRGEFSSAFVEKIQMELLQAGKVNDEWSMAILNRSERQVGRVRLKLVWAAEFLLSAPSK